jgi:hypothetical protein
LLKNEDGSNRVDARVDGIFFEPPMRQPFNRFVDIPEQIRQKSFKKTVSLFPNVVMY